MAVPPRPGKAVAFNAKWGRMLPQQQEGVGYYDVIRVIDGGHPPLVFCIGFLGMAGCTGRRSDGTDIKITWKRVVVSAIVSNIVVWSVLFFITWAGTIK